jgi:hypothetical protein
MHFSRQKRRALQLPNYQITHLLNLLSWPECPEEIEAIELSKVVILGDQADFNLSI